jgi:hypothetical protein
VRIGWLHNGHVVEQKWHLPIDDGGGFSVCLSVFGTVGVKTRCGLYSVSNVWLMSVECYALHVYMLISLI